MPAGRDHFDDVELLRRQNSFRREILNGDDVTAFGHDNDRGVARRNVADALVGERRHQFWRRNRFVVCAQVAELQFKITNID